MPSRRVEWQHQRVIHPSCFRMRSLCRVLHSRRGAASGLQHPQRMRIERQHHRRAMMCLRKILRIARITSWCPRCTPSKTPMARAMGPGRRESSIDGV